MSSNNSTNSKYLSLLFHACLIYPLDSDHCVESMEDQLFIFHLYSLVLNAHLSIHTTYFGFVQKQKEYEGLCLLVSLGH